MRENWAKKDHRRMRKCMRSLNRVIADDPLWRGRFAVSEACILEKHNFEDGSGGILSICYRFRDKRTGIVKFYYYTNYDYDHMFHDMNNFIVDDVAVWSENPRPSIENAANYN